MSSEKLQIKDLPGASGLIEWFGGCPSFHDAEVVDLHLCRTGESLLLIHTWKMTDKVVDGKYVLDKHTVVRFKLFEIRDLDLQGFNHQNVIQGINIEPCDGDIKLSLIGCFGLDGSIVASKVTIEFAAGTPESV